MLVLSRFPNEQIVITTSDGEKIRITLVKVDGAKARIGIDAKPETSIVRSELLLRPTKRKPPGVPA